MGLKRVGRRGTAADVLGFARGLESLLSFPGQPPEEPAPLRARGATGRAAGLVRRADRKRPLIDRPCR